MKTKITIQKAKSIQESIEDILDNFDFIACYDIEWERLKEIRKSDMPNLRIRDLKNQATKALQDVIAEAREYEKCGEDRFHPTIRILNGNFLALGQWIEEFDLEHCNSSDEQEITRYEEHLYLSLYYFVESGNTYNT